MRIRKYFRKGTAFVVPLAAALWSFQAGNALAADPPPPTQLSLTVSNTVKTVTWPRAPLPALDQNRLLVATNITNFSQVAPPLIATSPSGYTYRTVNSFPQQLYNLELIQLSSNDLLRANVLNRLAYGPTPDELERVAAIGAQAFIDEQLAPQAIPDTYDAYTAVYTNGVNLPPGTNWSWVSVTGVVNSSVLYMYLRAVGDLYIDDVRLQLLETNINCVTNITATETNITCTTNVVLGPNVLVNGDFEQPLAVGWTVAPNMVLSASSSNYAYAGNSSCHMVATAPGSTGTSGLQQTVTPPLPNNRRCVLSFAYLPNAYSRYLTLRLSGSGVIISGMDAPPPPSWIYETVTGRSTGSPFLYVYISGAGEAWIDDLKLVSGTAAGAGPNLLQNGDFESAFAPPWFRVGNHNGSGIDNTMSRSGSGSLHLVATGAGSGNGTNGNSVVHASLAVTNNGIYTLSYWYRPATQNRALTVRLSGQPTDQSPDRKPSGLRRRLDAANWGVSLDELRRWLCHNAVGSQRQLLEVLTQFFENHFVTYHSKTADYFDRYYDGSILDRIATDLEYREVSRWRNALLNPNCTFYDLLKIHVESPAQIIYLDTVASRGDANRIANENYARELFELFAMGVDNGYDQNDIVAMSRAWTGWTVDIVERNQINNPFAPRSQQYGQYPGVGFNQVSNIVGVWSFVYNTNWHGTNRAPILSEWNPNSPATNPVAIGPKRYAARFGPPWAGQSYQIPIPRRTGTNGIQDGYDVIRRLSENIHTAEYLSVKLCRIFIHDEFPNPTTHSDLPEYAFYDYTNPNRSAEAELVRRCIVAWDTPGPDGRRGNIRSVLRTIFDSELFRSHAGSRQKVKTPLEFLISSVRALRSVDVAGQATASTDGNFASALSRMGQMSLFNRADPDGYPEDGPPWISAGTLAERLRFVQALLIAAGGSGRGDAGNNTVDPVALLKRKLPAASWNNAGAVADFFLTQLYFGEGRANLDLYRASAINFLNTADNGTTTSLFSGLGNTSATYDTRVRGMVAMLMTFQRFQEQ